MVKIKIIKFYKLEEIAEKIFLDKNEKDHAYIEIPDHLMWDEFEELNNRVQYNWVESKFDAALSVFYHKGELHEVVRIYSNKIDLEYLQKLRIMYLDKLK